MQRARSLIPFSHDHHHGLVVCRHIREGLSGNVSSGRIMPYLLDFWDKYLRHHFEQEERTIFPLLPDDDSHLQQARTEHVHLRSLIKGLSSGNGADAREVLAVFAKDLEAHIRFEERILFPHIEHTVPEGWLSSVAVSAGGYAEDTNSWADAFWKA